MRLWRVGIFPGVPSGRTPDGEETCFRRRARHGKKRQGPSMNGCIGGRMMCQLLESTSVPSRGPSCPHTTPIHS
jgi:hypothetical protein